MAFMNLKIIVFKNTKALLNIALLSPFVYLVPILNNEKDIKDWDVINVCCHCCLISLFVLTCFNNSHFFLKNTRIFGDFLSVPYLVDIYAKMWMSGVGTLCGNAHCRSSLFV